MPVGLDRGMPLPSAVASPWRMPAVTAPADTALPPSWRAPVTAAVLIGALVFNAGLCLVNTVIFPVSDTLVMGCEMVLVALALGMAATRDAALYLILGLFVSYMLLLMAMRPMLDLKAVRDVLIPVAFYFLGRRLLDVRLVDKVALVSGAIVLAMGLFEYLDLDLFSKYFNVIQYYIARGTVAASEVTDKSSTLFASGMRPDARNILPFLGPHRVSSVFLEPVSAGNFGAILVMWGLVRRGMPGRWALMALGASAIVLSDARFGLYVCLVTVALTLAGARVPRVLVYLAPFGLLAGLAIYGLSSAQVDWENNLAGRMLWTARLITSLDLDGIFGLLADKIFLSDSGYAYSLRSFGLIGVVFLWALVVFGREVNPDAWRFKLLVAAYLTLLMLISDSPYSIKTAALMWFMLGTSDGVPWLAPARSPYAAAA